jgi:hypothetical protein
MGIDLGSLVAGSHVGDLSLAGCRLQRRQLVPNDRPSAAGRCRLDDADGLQALRIHNERHERMCSGSSCARRPNLFSKRRGLDQHGNVIQHLTYFRCSEVAHSFVSFHHGDARQPRATREARFLAERRL